MQRAAIRGGLEATLSDRVARETGSQGEVLQGSVSPFLCLCSFASNFPTNKKIKTS